MVPGIDLRQPQFAPAIVERGPRRFHREALAPAAFDDVEAERRPKGVAHLTRSHDEHNVFELFNHFTALEEPQISAPARAIGKLISQFLFGKAQEEAAPKK